LANHRLKSVATATAAAAAWAEVMTPEVRALALQNAQLVMQLHVWHQVQPLPVTLMLNVLCLADDCSSGGVDTKHRSEVLQLLQEQVHAQQVQTPAVLSALLQQREQ
jgi:hypothetical protein